MRHSTRTALRSYVCAVVTILAVLVYAHEAGARAPKPVGCQQMTEALAKALFEEWNKALHQNPETVVRTYTLDAVLLPTFQNGPLVGREQIRGYFDHFLEQHPVGRIDTRNIIPAGCNMGVVAGLYTFTVDEGTLRVDKRVRYTFVYAFKPEGGRGRWLISHHHSSAQPQKGVPN